MAGSDLKIALLLLPGMLLGFAASGRVKGRFEGRWIRNGILMISTVASVALLLRSILG